MRLEEHEWLGGHVSNCTLHKHGCPQNFLVNSLLPQSLMGSRKATLESPGLANLSILLKYHIYPRLTKNI